MGPGGAGRRSSCVRSKDRTQGPSSGPALERGGSYQGALVGQSHQASALCQKGLCPLIPDTPLTSGYTSNEMPVKAKRSTYNYSLPITVKKACKCLCSL